MISGPANTSTAEDRVLGYCLALEEAEIPVDLALIVRGEFHSTSGEQLTHKILNGEPKSTAIFAANNMIAIGVIKAVGQRGLHIPQDIALVCFDDFPEFSQVFPFLTVAVQPAYEMGTTAAHLLLDRLTSETDPQPRRVVLPTRLVIRHSCGGSKTRMLSLPLSADLQSEETGM